MYLDLEQHVSELVEKLPGSAEAVNIRIAQSLYPDLRGYRDHLGVVRLCSVSVNPIVDNIHMTHRSDQAGGSLEIMPFLLDKQIEIYADPPIYVVGQRNLNGFGEVALPDWESLLKDAELSNTVISKVRQYLKGHPPIDYKDVPD